MFYEYLSLFMYIKSRSADLIVSFVVRITSFTRYNLLAFLWKAGLFATNFLFVATQKVCKQISFLRFVFDSPLVEVWSALFLLMGIGNHLADP